MVQGREARAKADTWLNRYASCAELEVELRVGSHELRRQLDKSRFWCFDAEVGEYCRGEPLVDEDAPPLWVARNLDHIAVAIRAFYHVSLGSSPESLYPTVSLDSQEIEGQRSGVAHAITLRASITMRRLSTRLSAAP